MQTAEAQRTYHTTFTRLFRVDHAMTLFYVILYSRSSVVDALVIDIFPAGCAMLSRGL